MIYLRPTIFLITLCCYFHLHTQAQQIQSVKSSPADGLITGKIIDESNNKPIDFATVVLIDKSNNKTAKAAQTDLEGNFKLAEIAGGTYLLRISYVGYATIARDSITVNAGRKQINMGTLQMKIGKTSMLKEVAVVGQKNTIQLGIDKKIFSVDQSLVSEGGSATDLLSNVPSVSVDVNGDVSLRGSGNVRVLIDGKPSMLGGSISQVLEAIPASSIETVELITNPSSKYDPEGQSGIINIVLKKNKKIGMNGNVSVTGGTPKSFNINTGLSFQNKNFNIYGNYSRRYGERNGGGFSDRTNTPLNRDTTYYFNQTSNSDGSNAGDVFKAGIDYNISTNTSIGISGDMNLRSRSRTELGSTFGLNQLRELSRKNEQDNQSSSDDKSYGANLDFSTKFKKPKEELTANISYGNNKGDELDNLQTNEYIYLQNPVFNDRVQRNNNKGISDNWNLQLDYTNPIGKAGKMEAGYRSTFKKDDNDFIADTLVAGTQNFVTDANISSRFIYDEKIHAAYANYQQQFGNFGFQAGARVENANITTNNTDLNNEVLFNKQNYFRVYPSVYLTQKLQGDQTLQLSYSRRVNRPRGWQINPFLDKSDVLNYRQGNPQLRPEDVHSFELSYIKYWPKITLTSSLYYRQTNDVIERLRTALNDEGVQLTRFENLTSGTNTGFELIAKTDITPKWSFTSNLNFYKSQIKGNPALGLSDNNGFAWNGNVVTNFQLPLILSGQLRFDYRAPRIIAQGKTNDNYGVDAGIKKDFLSKKASLSLNARDIFNTRKFGWITSDPSFYMVSERRFQSRSINLTLSYRFGSLSQERQKSKKQQDAPQDAMPDEQM
ncbi:MAG: TonB-dependent receptor domain-containing protein [Sphingobacteriaceae bacterium]